MLKDVIDALWVNDQTQVGVAGGVGIVAFLAGLNWVAILSCILILGQIGLLVPKYWALFKKKREKNGTKD